jgi:hypothetical protein
MQRALAVAGFLDRVDFRPQVVGAKKVVGDSQPAGCVTL